MASKFFSFLGLTLEKELNRASHGVKEWKFSNGELNCSLEDVDKVCSCYMLPVKVLLLEKIDPSLISIRINI